MSGVTYIANGPVDGPCFHAHESIGAAVECLRGDRHAEALAMLGELERRQAAREEE